MIRLLSVVYCKPVGSVAFRAVPKCEVCTQLVSVEGCVRYIHMWGWSSKASSGTKLKR